MTPKTDYNISRKQQKPNSMMKVSAPATIYDKQSNLITNPTQEEYLNILKEWYMSQGVVIRDNKTGNALLVDHYTDPQNIVASLGVVYDKIMNEGNDPYFKIGNSDDQTLTALFSWLLSGMDVKRSDIASEMVNILSTRECSVATYYDEPMARTSGAEVVQSIIISMSLFINAERNKAFSEYINKVKEFFE